MLFRNYLTLEKRRALHLNKLESPSPKDALCQVRLKLAKWFWRRRWKCEKFTTTTTTTTTTTPTTPTTDNGQILIRKAHLSLRLRWAKNSCSKLNSLLWGWLIYLILQVKRLTAISLALHGNSKGKAFPGLRFGYQWLSRLGNWFKIGEKNKAFKAYKTP